MPDYSVSYVHTSGQGVYGFGRAVVPLNDRPTANDLKNMERWLVEKSGYNYENVVILSVMELADS